MYAVKFCNQHLKFSEKPLIGDNSLAMRIDAQGGGQRRSITERITLPTGAGGNDGGGDGMCDFSRSLEFIRDRVSELPAERL